MQGRGYGTEALRLLLRYAFDIRGSHRVVVQTLDSNEGMNWAALKAGMQLEGVERQAHWHEGRWRDVARLST